MHPGRSQNPANKIGPAHRRSEGRVATVLAAPTTSFRVRIPIMLVRQVAALAFLAALTFGSLGLTVGTAWYLRSNRYRESCAHRLSELLSFPAEIGRVVPRSRRTREFHAIRIWLPQRRAEIAFCQKAVLTQVPDVGTRYALELRGGKCEISTRTWLGEDYRLALESGLRAGFSLEAPLRVAFSGIDLTFSHGEFQATLADAGGTVWFDQPNLGQATATCYRLNGYSSSEPVVLSMEFTQAASGIRLTQVELSVPELPVEAVRLASLVGRAIQSGSFTGRLSCQETQSGRQLTVSGEVFQLQLAECTTGLVEPPWEGLVPQAELTGLTLLDGRPIRLGFRGLLTDLRTDRVLATWGLGDVGGRLLLRVHAAEFSPAGVDRLVVSGRAEGIPVEALARWAGRGEMTGLARVVLNDLTITQNRITSLDAQIEIRPNADQRGWIDRELLSQAFQRTVGLALPSFLPERIEYRRLGFRVDLHDGMLYVLGTHGPRGKAILSISVAGQEMPVLFEPESALDVSAPLERFRTYLTAYATASWQRLAGHGFRSNLPESITGPARE